MVKLIEYILFGKENICLILWMRPNLLRSSGRPVEPDGPLKCVLRAL